MLWRPQCLHIQKEEKAYLNGYSQVRKKIYIFISNSFTLKYLKAFLIKLRQ